MTKAKLTDYSLDELLGLTVEVVYERHETFYRVLVPVAGNPVKGKTLTQEEIKSLYAKLTA